MIEVIIHFNYVSSDDGKYIFCNVFVGILTQYLNIGRLIVSEVDWETIDEISL